MRKVDIYEYYSFGYNYFILVHNSTNDTIENVTKNVENYLKFISDLNLKVTKSSLTLQKFEEDFIKLQKLNKGVKKKEIIPKDIYDPICEKIKNADKTLDAELAILSAYYLDGDKRVSQEILENNIQKLFATNVYLSLPDVAAFDFSEAGKCLLFNRFTACAFHTLRGTEDTLKFYFQKLLNKVADETQTWGNFHSLIEKEVAAGTISPKPSEELMINLNSLRKFYRNKTQHPQMIYNSDEAQDLLFHCIKTVSEMILDLEKRKLLTFVPF